MAPSNTGVFGKSLWLLLRNLIRFPTHAVAATGTSIGNLDKKKVILDYWFGRVLCTGVVCMLGYLCLHSVEAVEELLWNQTSGQPREYFIPVLFFMLFLVWKGLIEKEWTHGRYLNLVPGQPPRFFFFGHGHVKLRRNLTNATLWTAEWEARMDELRRIEAQLKMAEAMMMLEKGKETGASVLWTSGWNPTVTLWNPEAIRAVTISDDSASTVSSMTSLTSSINYANGLVIPQPGACSIFCGGRANGDSNSIFGADFLGKPFQGALRERYSVVATAAGEGFAHLLKTEMGKVQSSGKRSESFDVAPAIHSVVFDALWDIVFGATLHGFSKKGEARSLFIKYADAAKEDVSSAHVATKGRRLREIIDAIISEHFKRPETSDPDYKGVINTLLLAEERISKYWGRSDTLNNLLASLYKGFRTITAGVEWILSDLSHTEKVIHQEIVVGGADGVYLQSCIKESLRLHPCIPFFSKSVSKTIKAGQFWIPRKTIVNVSVSMLHRSPTVWGVRKKLSKYDPTRHVPSAGGSNGPSLPYSYLPFGSGEPGCLASAVGNLLFRELIRSFVKEFDFHAPDSPPQKLGYDGMFLYVDGGVPLAIRKRRRAK